MATLKQAKKIIGIFEDVSTEQMQDILESGILTSIRDWNILNIDRHQLDDLFGGSIKNRVLKLISDDEEFVIDETNGSKRFEEAHGLFHPDPEFKSLVHKCLGTPRIDVNMYELKKSSTFCQIYSSISINHIELCLSEAQIISFISKYFNRLQTDGHKTFFLLYSGEQFVVVYYDVKDGDLFKCDLNDPKIWDFGFRCQFVVPKPIGKNLAK
jgi:hypothetical protein